ncbi:MAG: hypothetical protein JO074_05670, partial [Frankiales bacterium]|nr:hypothetical protein [Frankiales bacterium]
PGIWHVDDDAIAAMPDPLPRTIIGLIASHPSPSYYVGPDFTMTLGSRSPVVDGFTCWVDDAAPAACPTQVPLHESDGVHQLNAFGSDDSGDGPIMSIPVHVDAIAPTTVVTRPAAWTLVRAIPIAWSGSDSESGVASYDVRYQSAGGTAAFGSFRYPSGWQHTTATSGSVTGNLGLEYCFGARATDLVGNVGTWSANRCTAIPYDDRAFTTATGEWNRGSGSAYFEQTYTQSTTYGAALTHAPVTADRLALVATHCSTCGAVRVSIGGRAVATINLHASATWRVLTSVAFPAASGAVHVQVTSATGKLVRIDAIGFRRT